MRVLVTGGAGFIGSHLVKLLVESGHHVSVLDSDVTSNPYLKKDANVNYFPGDVRDLNLVNELVSQNDCVFHLASAVGVLRIMTNTIESVHSTVVGGINILTASQKHGKRVLMTSTSEIYGKFMGIPFEEDSDRVYGQTKNFRWSYAEAKSLIENAAYALAAESESLNFIIVRLFNTIGSGQLAQHGMVVPRFVQSALKNEPIYVYGDGSQKRTFCDVRDVVEALVALMLHSGLSQQVYNVGNSQEISILELATLIIKYTNSRSQIEFLEYSKAYPQGFEDAYRRIPNTQKIFKDINWQPKWRIDETLMSVIAYERSRIAKSQVE